MNKNDAMRTLLAALGVALAISAPSTATARAWWSTPDSVQRELIATPQGGTGWLVGRQSSQLPDGHVPRPWSLGTCGEGRWLSFVATSPGRDWLYVFDTEEGGSVGTALAHRATSAPVAVDDSGPCRWAVAQSNGSLVVLEGEALSVVGRLDGVVVSTADSNELLNGSLLVRVGNHLLVGGPGETWASVDLGNRAVRLHRTPGGLASGGVTASDGRSAYVVSRRGQLLQWTPEETTLLVDAGARVWHGPSVWARADGDWLLWADEAGRLHRYDGTAHRVIATELGPVRWPLAVVGTGGDEAALLISPDQPRLRTLLLQADAVQSGSLPLPEAVARPPVVRATKGGVIAADVVFGSGRVGTLELAGEGVPWTLRSMSTRGSAWSAGVQFRNGVRRPTSAQLAGASPSSPRRRISPGPQVEMVEAHARSFRPARPIASASPWDAEHTSADIAADLSRPFRLGAIGDAGASSPGGPAPWRPFGYGGAAGILAIVGWALAWGALKR